MTEEATPPAVRRRVASGPTVHIEQHPEALFHSVRAALTFAYSIAGVGIAPSPNLMPSTGKSGRLSMLSPHEKHAQGALIRRSAETRLRGMDLTVTFAFYGDGKMRSVAIREVSWEVAKLVRREGLGMELAKRAFSRNGVRRSQEALAHEFGTSRQTVQRLDVQVADEIHRLRVCAEEKLGELFIRTGIADSV